MGQVIGVSARTIQRWKRHPDGDDPTRTWPVASTVGDILRRQGLVRRRRRRRWSIPYGERLAGMRAPDAIWCADFNGHFAVGDARCHPLTIMEGFSRYLLRCHH